MYNQMPTIVNTIFGSQAASMGLRFALVEKTAEKVFIPKNKVPIINPMARCKPSPPRVLRDAMIAPIMVRIITETGVASLL